MSPESKDEWRERVLGYVTQAAADRPAHAAYLEELIAWHTDHPDEQGNEPDAGTGVSWDVMVALQGDVETAFRMDPNGPVSFTSPNEYAQLRDKNRRSAARRKASIEQASTGLAALLPPVKEKK